VQTRKQAHFVGRSAAAAASRPRASITAAAGAAATSASPAASYSAAGRFVALCGEGVTYCNLLATGILAATCKILCHLQS
jgi:hypothetical protein